MRFITLILISILFIVGLNAQVGINTVTPLSALDIRSTGNSPSTKAFAIKNNVSIPVLELRDNGQVFTAGVDTSSILVDLRDGENNSILAVGQSNQTALAAKGGVLKYDVTDKAILYSDGLLWKRFAYDKIKAFMVADIIDSTLTFQNSTTSPIVIKDWNVLADNTNSFDTIAGVFKAKTTGVYSVSLNITLSFGLIEAPSELLVVLKSSNGQEVKSITTFHAQTMSFASVECAGSFTLAVDDTLYVELWHSLGSDKKIRVGPNNFTVIEL